MAANASGFISMKSMDMRIDSIAMAGNRVSHITIKDRDIFNTL
jgi:hypothetical protein